MTWRSFIFSRHGETDWNKEERLQGHTDVSLNETGRTQAREAIPLLQKLGVNRIICSPLARAYETALIINASLRKPLLIDERLKEKCYGILEGMTLRECDAWRENNTDMLGTIEPELGRHLVPGMEPYAQFKARVLTSVEECLDRFQNEKLVIIAHGACSRVLSRAFDVDLRETPNVQPLHFDHTPPATWRVNPL